MEDALAKMQIAILEQKLGTRATSEGASTLKADGSSAAGLLANLKQLLDKGVINQMEYDEKRKKIVDAL
jgi:hypothetical protein